jgi:hypothetical protein
MPTPFTWFMTILEVSAGAAIALNGWPVAGGVLIGMAMGTQLSRIARQCR